MSSSNNSVSCILWFIYYIYYYYYFEFLNVSDRDLHKLKMSTLCIFMQYIRDSVYEYYKNLFIIREKIYKRPVILMILFKWAKLYTKITNYLPKESLIKQICDSWFFVYINPTWRKILLFNIKIFYWLNKVKNNKCDTVHYFVFL